MTVVLATVAFVYGRSVALLLVLPVFSAKGVPRYVPLLFALAVTAVIAPTVPPAHVRGFFEMTLGFAGEVGIGLMLGLVVQATFAALALGAELMSTQMGLSMANVLDPFLRTEEATLGSLASWLGAAVFVASGLHVRCIEALAASFVALPPGTAGLPSGAASVMVAGVSSAFALGVQLSGPMLAMAWMINVFVALLSKLAPRMNAFFAVGTTATAAAGLVVFAASLPWLLTGQASALAATIDGLGRVVLAVK